MSGLLLISLACASPGPTKSGTQTVSVDSAVPADSAKPADTNRPVDTAKPDDSGSKPRDCSWGPAAGVQRVQSEDLREISGLSASRVNPGVLWVLEDSDRPALITALDAAGLTLGTISMDGITNIDWEDLASGPCGEEQCLFVGEVGDNGESKESVLIHWFIEPELPPERPFALTVTANSQRFTYPEGPQNVEALVVEPSGSPVVLTKRMDGLTRLYRVPLGVEGTASAELLSSLDLERGMGLPTLVTAADLWPDGTRLLVRTYALMLEIPIGPDGLESASMERAVQLEPAIELQGESAAYQASPHAIWHISEGSQPMMNRLSCE